ncbi:hypothetical protein ACWDFH_07955 [Streptomyces kronopolitis]
MAAVRAAGAVVVNCDECRTLRAELADAVRRGDKSKAVDCRVLLRRHPQHDGVPVEGEEA